MPAFSSFHAATAATRTALGICTALALSLATPAMAERSALDRIAAEGRITIAIVEDLPPFSIKGENGVPTGMSVELCRAVVNELATQLEVPLISIDYVPVTLNTRLDSIVSGRADMECGATTVTLSRRERVDFSVPFFATGAALGVTSSEEITDLAALSGKRLAAITGTTTLTAIKRAVRAERMDVEIVEVERTEDALTALNDGTVDAIAHDKMILLGLMQEDAGAGLVALPGLLSFEPYGIILPRGDADLRLAVDRAIIGLYQDGVLNDLFDTWLAPMGAQPGVTLDRMLQLQAVPE